MKTLRDIIYRTGLLEIAGPADIAVLSVQFDSRKIEKGTLFIAVKGLKSDGHDFIGQAIEKGATSILCETLPTNLVDGISYIRVTDSAAALGFVASNFHDTPSEKLKTVGITGTNGKTTTASLLHDTFLDLGYKSGLLSTVVNKINERNIPSTHTTPDALALNELMGEMVNDGCGYCFMEVSSHAIAQKRISGLQFTGGVFTNLTHDHLDFHETFDAYLKAKKTFFNQLPSSAFALVNLDDKNGMVMVQNTRAKIHTYGLKSMATFRAKVMENRFDGMQLKIDGREIWTRLVGNFNASNILAIYSTAVLLGEDPSDVLTILSEIRPVEGRFDHIISNEGVIAIVDYAHTPDAVKNVLSTINEIRTHNEQLITVIGAGGDRDRSKRPVMAGIAAQMSNKVILTSDNPRSEEPEMILEEMKKGIDPSELRKVITIVNRKEAIAAACSMARSGDIILVAGKGHEKYQEIKGIKYPFDDKALIREAFGIQDSQKEIQDNN